MQKSLPSKSLGQTWLFCLQLTLKLVGGAATSALYFVILIQQTDHPQIFLSHPREQHEDL